MRRRLLIEKIPIIIVLLLLVTAAFTFIYTLYDTAAAPFEIREEPNPGDYEADENSGELDEPEDKPKDAEDEPDEPKVFIDPGFVTVYMDESDIFQGYLLLVNQDHKFDIPERLDLVNLTAEKTTAFRVLGEQTMIRGSIIEPLDEMMDAFITETGNNSVAIISAYRSLNFQQTLLDRYTAELGLREALRWASLPGHSEHHTGLSIDFGVYTGGTRRTFTGTGTTSWFRQNSYNFGFIHRYPRDKTRVTRTAYEPWHFRFVGLPHSYIMFQNNWALEEYIELLREYTFDEPLVAEFNGIEYRIYFTLETAIPIPYDVLFDISGNNIDGFIVTVHRPDEHVVLAIDAQEDGES